MFVHFAGLESGFLPDPRILVIFGVITHFDFLFCLILVMNSASILAFYSIVGVL